VDRRRALRVAGLKGCSTVRLIPYQLIPRMNDRTHSLQWLRLWVTIAWLLVGAIVYLSLMPAPPDVDLSDGDKVAHLLAYAVVTLWFVQIYESPRSRVVIALGLVLLGIGLEFLQGYSGYRSLEIADMGANAGGVVLGWVSAPPRTPNVLVRIERYMTR
jgi:VanZ family protein